MKEDNKQENLLTASVKAITSFDWSLFDKKSEAKESGELTFIGEQHLAEVQSQLYQYSLQECKVSKDLEEFEFLSQTTTDNRWLNFHGLHDTALIQKVGNAVPLDRITVRQLLDTTLRPKVEEYDKYLFFSIKSATKTESGGVEIEQISFVLGKNFVISFQEKLGDHFQYIRNKIEEDLGLSRKKGTDFLLFQLLDAIIDNYLEVLELVNGEIRQLEKDVMENPRQESLVELEKVKQLITAIKKSLTPFKDALRTIQNRNSAFIEADNQKYFSDLTNNCLGVLEEVDASLKSLEGITNIYFSALSQKMNETMKVLTTVATIFIPLTFIAGIYGMNFENMPELRHPNGYFITWGVMGAILIAMIIYFRVKKWL